MTVFAFISLSAIVLTPVDLVLLAIVASLLLFGPESANKISRFVRRLKAVDLNTDDRSRRIHEIIKQH